MRSAIVVSTAISKYSVEQVNLVSYHQMYGKIHNTQCKISGVAIL